MATTYKVLGQVSSAQTATSLYTVPSATQTVASTLNVCNLSTSNTYFRVAVRTSGAALANTHYIAYDTPLGASDTIGLTLGLTLGATDIVSVSSTSGNVTFSLFGSEIT